MRYLINLSYNGSLFYGYQIQNNKITVEGEIEKTLSKILNTNINTIAASRTDKGVHAINQYCHFDYDKRINLKKEFILNAILDTGKYKKLKKDKNFSIPYILSLGEVVYASIFKYSTTLINFIIYTKLKVNVLSK